MESNDKNPANTWLKRLDEDLDSDSIHEGISDDELDKLLIGDIKNTTSLKNPITNEDLSGNGRHDDLMDKLFDADESGTSQTPSDDFDDLDLILTQEIEQARSATGEASGVQALGGDDDNDAHELSGDEVGEERELQLLDEVSYTATSSQEAGVTQLEVEGAKIKEAGANAASLGLQPEDALDYSVGNESDAPIVMSTADGARHEEDVSGSNALKIADTEDAAVNDVDIESIDMEGAAIEVAEGVNDGNDGNANVLDNDKQAPDSAQAEPDSETGPQITITRAAQAATVVAATQPSQNTPSPNTSKTSSSMKSDDAQAPDKALTSAALADKTSTTNSESNKPTPKTHTGTTHMQGNQQTQIEKILSDIDELKRKLHGMNSDFYNAATDSAVLISEVRELEVSTQDGQDFSGTYTQSRDLRRTLVEARKSFNTLASAIDELEEALETDLYAVQKG